MSESEFEADGFRVNMSDQEAASQAREDLPAGKFHLKITDIDISYTKETSKHPGQPYINFEFTVQDGRYASRKDWTNAMCFSPALYTISQILKALGMSFPTGPDGKPRGGDVVIPRAREFYIGKDLWGIRSMNKKNKDADGNPDPRIELRGFLPYVTGESTTTGATPAAASASVLP